MVAVNATGWFTDEPPESDDDTETVVFAALTFWLVVPLAFA
jgi:hypothetical protein